MRIAICLIAVILAACAANRPAAAPSPAATSQSPSVVPPTTVPASASPAATGRPFSATLAGPIQRLDAKVGFATTETGLIATDDGGASWSARARTDGAFFNDLRFVDASHGWAVAERWAPGTICLSPTTAPPCWTVMTTSDGGRSWQDSLSVPGNQLGTAPVTSLQAIDARRAWVVVQTATCEVQGCIGELRTTSDGGRTWSTQVSHVGGLGPLRIASAARGWIGAARAGDPNGGSDVLVTGDGGATWTTAYRATTSVIAIDAATEREAWILTRDGGYCTSSNCSRYELLHTNDGGATWSTYGNPDEAACSAGHLRGPLFASPTLGWIAISTGPGGAGTPTGGLMRTQDGGRTWDCRAAPQNVSYVSAADPRAAWVRSDPGGSSLKGSIPQLFATEDGGESWQVVPIAIR